MRDVQELQSPLSAGGQGLVSRDGHSVLVNFQIPGSDSETSQKVGPILDAVRDLQRSHPGYVVEELGGASGNRELDATVGNDLARAEKLSLPITLLILVVAFGALVAASIPVLLAFTAVKAGSAVRWMGCWMKTLSTVRSGKPASAMISAATLLLPEDISVSVSSRGCTRSVSEKAAATKTTQPMTAVFQWEALHRPARAARLLMIGFLSSSKGGRSRRGGQDRSG